jgi:thiamine kinase-like enzyme
MLKVNFSSKEEIMTITIEEVIQKIDDWNDKPFECQEMTGGLTNRNYRVDVGGQAHFVRVPGADTELLAVDRDNEYHSSKAAAAAGVGPKVLYYLPEHKVMVLEFLKGETMSIEALGAPGMPTRIAQSLKKLHSGSRCLNEFNMFRLVEFYMRIVEEHNVRIPDDYRDRMSVLSRIEKALDKHRLPDVPCNNDLLAENYIDDGQMLWLIDFEYSGNNDPCFELGNTCQEQQYNEDQYAELCAAYFGETRRHLLARMYLFSIMSDFGWTQWGAIQNKISKLDYDFWEYAMGRWERCLGMLDSNKFSKWLDDAGRDD